MCRIRTSPVNLIGFIFYAWICEHHVLQFKTKSTHTTQNKNKPCTARFHTLAPITQLPRSYFPMHIRNVCSEFPLFFTFILFGFFCCCRARYVIGSLFICSRFRLRWGKCTDFSTKKNPKIKLQHHIKRCRWILFSLCRSLGFLRNHMAHAISKQHADCRHT